MLELEEWGAVFDRTKEGLICQRNFGGHRYPRLAHVGDRTGLELIRSLQDHGIHQGIDFLMEATAIALLKDGERIAGVAAYFRDTGRFRAAPLQGRDHGDRRRRRAHGRVTQQLVGVHRRRLRARLRRRRRADGPGVHAVPSDRHGVAALGARHARHRRRARRRRHLAEQQGRTLHVQLHPGEVRRGDREHRGGGAALARRRQERAPPARAADARRGRARDHRRGQGRPRLAARRRVPRHRLAAPARVHQAASCRRCITSSRSWPRSTSPRSRWKSARRCTTSWAASASTPTRR